MSYYIHITYVNKPKNKFEEEIILLLKESDGKMISDTNLEAYKRNWKDLISLIKKRYPRVKKKDAEWRKSKTATGKDMWLLNMGFIGFELLKVTGNE